MSRIRVKEGARETVHEIADGVLTIGRSPDNHVVLTDKECSRHHCIVERVEMGYKMVDLESRNGTKANGRFANQHLLQPGDVVTIGNAEMHFEPEGERAGAARPASRPVSTAAPPAPPPASAEPGFPRAKPGAGAPPSARAERPAPRGPSGTARSPDRHRRPRAVRERGVLRWVFSLSGLFLLLLVGAIVYSVLNAESPEERRAREVLLRAQALERKAASLTDPEDQARQVDAALAQYRLVPDASPTHHAAAQQKIPQLEKLRERCLVEARERKLQGELEAVDRYRDSRVPPDTLGTIARYQALLERVPADLPLRQTLEERIREMSDKKP